LLNSIPKQIAEEQPKQFREACARAPPNPRLPNAFGDAWGAVARSISGSDSDRLPDER